MIISYSYLIVDTENMLIRLEFKIHTSLITIEPDSYFRSKTNKWPFEGKSYENENLIYSNITEPKIIFHKT